MTYLIQEMFGNDCITAMNPRRTDTCRTTATEKKVTHCDGVGGRSVDVQGRGVVVRDGSSGQRGWRGEANGVTAIGQT